MKKNILKTIVLTLIFIFVITNAAAQNDEILIQLTGYDAETQQSKIHIENNAGFELNELDFYINNIRTGRIASKLNDGQAVVYFQTITPGTYDVTIKTKEGIESTKQIKFTDLKQQAAETQQQTQKPKTASQLANDPEYQEFLEEQKKEQEVREQRKQEELRKTGEPELEPQKVTEEKETIEEELQKKVVKKQKDYSTAIVISILIFIFILIYIFKRKNRV